MEKKKSPIGITTVIICILLLILLSVCGYVIYTQYESLKNKDNIIEDLNKGILNNDTSFSTVKTDSEKYNEYIQNIKSQRNKEVNAQYIKKTISNNDWYSLSLDKDGNLQLECSDTIKEKLQLKDNYLIAVKVLKFYLVLNGENDLSSLFYIKEDGTLFRVDIELAYQKGEKLTENEISKKNIIEVVSYRKENTNIPFLIDINGNIQEAS